MKNKILLYFIFSSLVIVTLSLGCYYDTVIPDVSVYSGDEVTFSTDILPIFNSSCNSTGCHNPGGIAPDLSASNSFAALQNGGYINLENPEQSELYQWVKGNRTTTMPISGTSSQIASSILSWIKQGALNN